MTNHKEHLLYKEREREGQRGTERDRPATIDQFTIPHNLQARAPLRPLWEHLHLRMT